MRTVIATACALALLIPRAAQAAEPRTPRTPRTPSEARLRLSTPERPRTPVGAREGPRAPQRGPDPTPSAPPSLEPEPTPSGSVADRVAAAWPGDDARVLRLVRCETGGTFDPTVVGPTARDGSRYRGLFQMDARFWRTYGGHAYASRPDLASVEQQTEVAWRGFEDRGWQPWPTCGYV